MNICTSIIVVYVVRSVSRRKRDGLYLIIIYYYRHDGLFIQCDSGSRRNRHGHHFGFYTQ